MPRLSYAFFTVAALYGLAGMIWGSRMGATGDHSSLAAHAHLNLLGWVGMAVMGAFHALAPRKVPAILGWANFALSAAGALGLAVAMGFLMGAGDRRFVPLVVAAGISAILGMAAFLISVLIAWQRSEDLGSTTSNQ